MLVTDGQKMDHEWVICLLLFLIRFKRGVAAPRWLRIGLCSLFHEKVQNEKSENTLLLVCSPKRNYHFFMHITYTSLSNTHLGVTFTTLSVFLSHKNTQNGCCVAQLDSIRIQVRLLCRVGDVIQPVSKCSWTFYFDTTVTPVSPEQPIP